MTQEKKLIIDTKDYRDIRVIFTFDKWQEKSIQHPELQDKTFLKNLKETIENPEEVWQDSNRPHLPPFIHSPVNLDRVTIRL